jgi:hypothetical protein
MGKSTGASDPRIDSHRFGSVAYLLGYVTLRQIQQALAEQVEDNVSGRGHRLLGTIFRENRWINEGQENTILAEMDATGR